MDGIEIERNAYGRMGIYQVPLPAHTKLTSSSNSPFRHRTVQPRNATLDKESGLYTYTGYKLVEFIGIMPFKQL